MMRALCLVMTFALFAAGRLAAQQDSATFRRAVVHYGKWLPLAVAAAFTAMGAHEHTNSQREFDRLIALCRANDADCLLGPDGRYLNPAAERLYQSSVNFDRRARARLLAGQASLIVAAGLFIADLRRRSGRPANKPFSPLDVGVVPGAAGSVLVGIRVAF